LRYAGALAYRTNNMTKSFCDVKVAVAGRNFNGRISDWMVLDRLFGPLGAQDE